MFGAEITEAVHAGVSQSRNLPGERGQPFFARYCESVPARLGHSHRRIHAARRSLYQDHGGLEQTLGGQKAG